VTHALLHGSHYLAVIAACLAAVRPLAGGRWTWRAPRTAIVLWQTLAASLVSSLVGLCLAIGLSPYRSGELHALARLAAGDPPAGFTVGHVAAVAAGLAVAAALAAMVAWQFAAVIRVRSRHRSRLSLVAEPDPADPALLLVDHPAALAYCLPGRGRTMVVSSGAVGLLDRDQLAAVLDHERAHLRERHDLVLLPFAALCRALPRSRQAARAYAAVSLLVEMRADDRALRRHPPGRLASALRAVGGAGGRPAPEGAMAIADPQVSARLDRLAQPPRTRRVALCTALAIAALTASTPISLYLLP
jgi:Zn-dependent protease with chaperone function